MINKLSTLCAAVLALSTAGLVNAATIDNTQLLTYSVISGAGVNIAAQPHVTDSPNVGGHLAAKAAVVVGANTTVNDIYAGAAVTTGDGSHVKQIYAGAAAGVGANAFAQDVDAGAAVVVGANGVVGKINAGAAITLGAGATYFPNPAGLTITHGAGSMESETTTQYKDLGVIVNAEDMLEALSIIKKKITDNPVKPLLVAQFKDLSGQTIGQKGPKEYYSAINIQANTTLSIVGGHLTIITSEAVTLGAGAEIVLLDGATVTWILGGSLNLGAGSKFKGETYVKGAVNGATSDVCGKLFATGFVSVRSIEAGACPKPTEDTAAEEDEETAEEDEDAVATACPLWEGSVGWDGWVSSTYSDWVNAGVITRASVNTNAGNAAVYIGAQVATFTSIAAVTGKTVTIELHDVSSPGTDPIITHSADDGATWRREVYYTDGLSNKPGHTNSWQTCVTDFETNFGA